jgi:hypothetical protein
MSTLAFAGSMRPRSSARRHPASAELTPAMVCSRLHWGAALATQAAPVARDFLGGGASIVWYRILAGWSPHFLSRRLRQLLEFGNVELG